MKLTLIVLLLTSIIEPSFGQVVSGAIVGVVQDASGASVAGAQVSVTNQGTNQKRETTTDSSGAFSLPTLPPGRYTVAATNTGFKSAQVANLELLIDQTVRLELKLEIGDVAEKVNVEATAALLQTESPTLGQVIEEKPIVDLPLNGRNFIQLATMSAGVVPATNNSSESSRLGRSQITAHVAGARGSFNSFLIDGMESRGARFGETPILPSLDAIKEFKIQRNFYSAEYGENIGLISISIKSGTNQIHGSVYEFLRNDNLDARQFFDRAKPEFKLNQYGFSLGGPLIRNKTFLFGAWEGRRQRRANQQFATVPDPQWLTGNFSNRAAPIRDPFNNNQPFPGNIIPANRLSTVSRNYNQYIPAPNTNLPQGNYAGAPNSTDDFDQYHVRVDHQFSNSDTMFGRYSKSDWNIAQPGLLPFRGLAFPLDGQNVVIQETHIFGPRTVNTVKIGYSRGFLSSALIPADRSLQAELGLRNVAPLPPDFSLPQVSYTGFTSNGFAANTFRHWTNTYAISDTLALIRGRHNITLGGDVRHTRTPTITTNNANGTMAYTDRFTGFSVADYVLGAFTTASALGFTTARDFRFNQYALFVQDDYKLTSRLTVNLGLRYEYQQPWREKGGTEGVFDPSIPGIRLANDPIKFGGVRITAPFLVVGGVREGVVRPDFADWAPRVGLAYRLTNKTVLRGGYGVFYAMNQGNDSGNISQNPGAAGNTNLTNSPGFTPRLADTLFDDARSSLINASTSISSTDPEKRTPYMQQWNLNVQQELPGEMVFEIGYVGSHGAQLMERRDINQARLNRPGENLAVQARRPIPQFQNILLFEGGNNSNYNALTLHLERRFRKGFSLLTNYTFAKSLDDSSRSIDDGASPHHVSDNRKLEYAPSAFDIRHRVVLSALYELPFARGAAGPARWILGGWQVNSILAFQTGYPFSITIAGDQSNTGVQATQRPNRVGYGILPNDQKLPERWFDTTAYAINPLNTFGNAGRNTVWQDGTKSTDVSLFKNFPFRENRYTVQFRAEFFNLLNNVNFGRPGASINGANFGVVTASGLAREIQLALKLVW